MYAGIGSQDGWRIAIALSAALVLGSCGSTETSERPAPGSESSRARTDRLHGGLERKSRAAANAEPAELMPGIGRPCAEARHFDHYYLGSSFEGLELTNRDRKCDPPPRKIPDDDGTLVYEVPGRINLVSYTYGTCDPQPKSAAAGVEGGCIPPLSVSSTPACERPHSLVHRYATFGPPWPHRHVRIRGAPATVIIEPAPPGAPERPGGGISQIEVYTGDAAVTIAAAGRPRLLRRAAEQLVAPPSSLGGVRSPGAPLPEPREGAAEDDAKENPAC